MPIGVYYIGVHIGATWRIRLNRPGKFLPGNVLSGKRLSGKVIVRETSVTHAALCQITLIICFRPNVSHLLAFSGPISNWSPLLVIPVKHS